MLRQHRVTNSVAHDADLRRMPKCGRRLMRPPFGDVRCLASMGKLVHAAKTYNASANSTDHGGACDFGALPAFVGLKASRDWALAKILVGNSTVEQQDATPRSHTICAVASFSLQRSLYHFASISPCIQVCLPQASCRSLATHASLIYQMRSHVHVRLCRASSVSLNPRWREVLRLLS